MNEIATTGRQAAQGFRRARSVASIAAVAASAVFAAGPLGAAEVTPNQRALNHQLAQLVHQPDGPPGAIALVQRGRSLTVHRAGVARVDGPAPTPRDAMRIASVTKTLTTATALGLVREGSLSLDSTIGEVLPGLPRAWHAVSLAQLMRHTSGVPDFIANPRAQRYLLRNLGNPPPPARLLVFVEDEPLEFLPGSRYRYSNSDNIIIALMVERAGRERFERQLARRVLTPLRMSRTSLPRGTSMPPGAMRGYQPDSTSRPADVTSALAAGWAWSAGGVVSTPAELNRFIRAYAGGEFTGPRLRRAQLLTVAGSSEPTGPGINRTGLSLFRYSTRCGVVWGHTGNTLGYTQFAAASADGARSAVVSVNAQISPRTNPRLYGRLRAIYARAACTALEG